MQGTRGRQTDSGNIREQADASADALPAAARLQALSSRPAVLLHSPLVFPTPLIAALCEVVAAAATVALLASAIVKRSPCL